MAIAGRCACGAVTGSVEGQPIAVRQCWCRQCQQIACGSPTNNAIFLTEQLSLSGELAQTRYIAASGNTLTQSFCARCGTPVFAQSSARPHMRTIRLGFLDPDHGLAPTAAIWTEEAPSWAAIDPTLENVPRQPPPPQPSAT